MMVTFLLFVSNSITYVNWWLKITKFQEFCINFVFLNNCCFAWTTSKANRLSKPMGFCGENSKAQQEKEKAAEQNAEQAEGQGGLLDQT